MRSPPQRRREVAGTLRGTHVQEIATLHRQGLSISQIARLMNLSRTTIRKYLKNPGTPVYGPRAKRPSKLDPHKTYIDERLRQDAWNATVLLAELRERGYTGGYTALKDYLAPKRREAREVAVRRFETRPGEQAQVDWGHFGELHTEHGRASLSCFAMTLGHSRAMFADVATSQSFEVFLRLHEEAFRAFGGVPEEILYDNIKTVVLSYDHRGEPIFNQALLDFARYWGFRPRLCRPYRPQTKGKIESGIGYLKRSFLCGRSANSLDDLRAQLASWLKNVANVRVHGTTHRIVSEALDEERPHLLPLDLRPPYPYIREKARRVARDAYVTYGTNRYSVPWQVAGRRVALREDGDHLVILLDGQIIATHALHSRRCQTITDSRHHDGMPYAPSGRRSKRNHIVIFQDTPEVQARSLDDYQVFADLALPAELPAQELYREEA